MCSEIVGQNVIGLFIIGGNLSSEIYNYMLVNRIIPTIINVEGLNLNSRWFQQGVAVDVCNFMDQTCRE